MVVGYKLKEVSIAPQEKIILQMLWDGLRNKEIALAMGLSDKTVKNYKDTLYKKLGVSHSMQLARRAVELGLVPIRNESVRQDWP